MVVSIISGCKVTEIFANCKLFSWLFIEWRKRFLFRRHGREAERETDG